MIIEKVKGILYEKKASLVVYKNGEIHEYYNHGIKDLREILSKDENALKGAVVADTTVGKAAGAIMIKAEVKEIFADKISKLVIPLLEKYNVKYEYREIVDYIQNKDKTGMCPMEEKVRNEQNIEKILEFIM